MGTYIHHYILVTGHWPFYMKEARDKAMEIFGDHIAITEMIRSKKSRIVSFVIMPDGSKEGWDDSNHGNELRAQFVDWLDRFKWGDGSGPLDWCEVQLGESEDQRTFITRHHDDGLDPKDYSLERTETMDEMIEKMKILPRETEERTKTKG